MTHFLFLTVTKKTFAEMAHSDKIFIDHRSIALKKLIKLHLSDS